MPYAPFDLTGKVTLITGGNSGIGLGMAEALAQAGAGVCIWGTNPDKNAQATAHLQITANAIIPGWIETPMTERRFQDERFATNVLKRITFRRWGTPQDFGGIAVYLMSDAARYHTGDTIIIDGGLSKS